MKFVPAIDLRQGRCVQLVQGDFAEETRYPDNPREALARFASAGAQEVHIVDLDGAKAGYPVQHPLIASLAADRSIKVQMAGGFRSARHVETMLGRGVHRVILGSLAPASPGAFMQMVRRFGPEHVGVALDVRIAGGQAMVARDGWSRGSGSELFSVLKDLRGVRHVLVTDISRDGMLNGPNVDLMKRLLDFFPDIELQASGGVRDARDLTELRRAGASRAIVGKAIWEGLISVEEGLAHAGS
jgi:phosphoribosylformimino-5-aminoimidazole carboxamide ribotide isomerase